MGRNRLFDVHVSGFGMDGILGDVMGCVLPGVDRGRSLRGTAQV